LRRSADCRAAPSRSQSKSSARVVSRKTYRGGAWSRWNFASSCDAAVDASVRSRKIVSASREAQCLSSR
jgi:hypothetical protein